MPLAGRVRDVMRCGVMQSSVMVGQAPDAGVQVGRRRSAFLLSARTEMRGSSKRRTRCIQSDIQKRIKEPVEIFRPNRMNSGWTLVHARLGRAHRRPARQL